MRLHVSVSDLEECMHTGNDAANQLYNTMEGAFQWPAFLLTVMRNAIGIVSLSLSTVTSSTTNKLAAMTSFCQSHNCDNNELRKKCPPTVDQWEERMRRRAS